MRSKGGVAVFLSCLLGSEVAHCFVVCVQIFLSCLLGSEVGKIAGKWLFIKIKARLEAFLPFFLVVS